MTSSQEESPIAENKNETKTSNKTVDQLSSQSLIDSNLMLWTELRIYINQLNLIAFQKCINQQVNFYKIASLKPRLINEALQECLDNSSKTPISNTSSSSPDGCDFIEVLMTKLHKTECYFVSWDDTCKSIVRTFIDQRRQFSMFTLCFLLRCYDLDLLRSAFEYDLVDACYGNCQNWHIMFIASYQERFFTASIENIFEGFMCRYILLSKLRCLLEQKR